MGVSPPTRDFGVTSIVPIDDGDPVAGVLSRRASVLVLPSIRAALVDYRRSGMKDEARRRFDKYKGLLRTNEEGGILPPGPCRREPSGRIHCDAQNIANVLRPHFAPAESGRVFLDADYVSAHIAIAASRSGDPKLAAVLAAGDAYEAIGRAVFPGVRERDAVRKVVKRCAIALINGSGANGISQLMRDLVDEPSGAAAAFTREWRDSFPALDAYVRDRLRVINTTASPPAVETLTGRQLVIPTSPRDRLGWLSAHWASVEAEAADVVLTQLEERLRPLGARLVLPMFDGFLLDAPSERADEVGAALDSLMVEAMSAVGVPGARVKIEVRPRWGASPESATGALPPPRSAEPRQALQRRGQHGDPLAAADTASGRTAPSEPAIPLLGALRPPPHFAEVAAVSGCGAACERWAVQYHLRSGVAALVRGLRAPAAFAPVHWPGSAQQQPVVRASVRTGDCLRGAADDARCARGERWTELATVAGAMLPDRLAIVVGIPGRGKSSFAVQVAEAAARAGHPVLYASAEMSSRDIVARLIALRSTGAVNAHVAYVDVLRGRFDDHAVALAGEDLVRACPHLYVWDPLGRDRTGERLCEAAQYVSTLAGGMPPLVIVDYLQRFAGLGDERRGEVAALSGTLRDLSRPGGLNDRWPGAAVLALSSTARQAYALFSSTKALAAAFADEALIGTGKETGEIEYDAGLVIALTTDTAPGDAARNALAAVAKNRDGALGLAPMTFLPSCGRFCAPTTPGTEGERNALAVTPRSRAAGRRGPKTVNAESAAVARFQEMR